MAYAERTKVSAIKTRVEIERTLRRYGADRFAYFTEPGRAVVVFETKGLRMKFVLPVPTPKLEDQRWRALYLCIKAKLEAVASKIETFEEAFFAHVVLPDGQTVYERSSPHLKELAQGKDTYMPPLLGDSHAPP